MTRGKAKENGKRAEALPLHYSPRENIFAKYLSVRKIRVEKRWTWATRRKAFGYIHSGPICLDNMPMKKKCLPFLALESQSVYPPDRPLAVTHILFCVIANYLKL